MQWNCSAVWIRTHEKGFSVFVFVASVARWKCSKCSGRCSNEYSTGVHMDTRRGKRSAWNGTVSVSVPHSSGAGGGEEGHWEAILKG